MFLAGLLMFLARPPVSPGALLPNRWPFSLLTETTWILPAWQCWAVTPPWDCWSLSFTGAVSGWSPPRRAAKKRYWGSLAAKPMWRSLEEKHGGQAALADAAVAECPSIEKVVVVIPRQGKGPRYRAYLGSAAVAGPCSADSEEQLVVRTEAGPFTQQMLDLRRYLGLLPVEQSP